jgi:hypothetical protein
MNTEFLAKQIAADTKRSSDKFIIQKSEKDLIGYSRQMWSYFGYTGSSVPWHDRGASDQLYYKAFKPVVSYFLKWLEKEDISIEAFSVLSMSVRSPKDWETPAKLYSAKKPGMKDWIIKLRKHAGSSENLDLVALVLFRFFELQIENFGVAEINKNRVIQADSRNYSGKCLELYHQLTEREGFIFTGTRYRSYFVAREQI